MVQFDLIVAWPLEQVGSFDMVGPFKAVGPIELVGSFKPVR